MPPVVTQVVDAHHHFLDTQGTSFQKFLRSVLGSDAAYGPDAYQKDVADVLQSAGVSLLGSVHVECMPDSGYDEAKWVQNQTSTVRSIVASVDLASDRAPDELAALKADFPKVVGIRWILDCVTDQYEPNTATHVAVRRHDTIVDYLRGGEPRGEVWSKFANGYACLAQHNYSFDLQCAPEQLLAAASLAKKHPDIPVVVDHLGKPRDVLLGNENSTLEAILEQPEIATWRNGLQAMATLPHVYIKISMLGYCIPGWCQSPLGQSVLRSLVCEVVALFGPQRCMMAFNWWSSASLSDSDGASDVGPSPVEYINFLTEWLADYSAEDRNAIFCGTAQEFYKM